MMDTAVEELAALSVHPMQKIYCPELKLDQQNNENRPAALMVLYPVKCSSNAGKRVGFHSESL